MPQSAGTMGPPFAKKRKFSGEGVLTDTSTFKPSARFKPTRPRDWTVAVAVPTSMITDCVKQEQMTTCVGRVARALAVFSLDEVVIFDDSPPESRPADVDQHAYSGHVAPAHFMEHLLTYLETPPFMRKVLFPLHPNLRSSGLLPSLDMPHHPHKDEWLPYREGMTLPGRPATGTGTSVDIGMPDTVTIAEDIPPRTRLTLKMPEDGRSPEPVHPAGPRTEAGYYWGFGVRTCASLSSVFTTSPHDDGYDLSIGTSERAAPLSRVFPAGEHVPFKHLLVVFGGPRGLEFAAMNDPDLRALGIQGPRTRELFDRWINILPNQGSRTIRTDEAMLIGLAGLRRLWDES